MKKYNKTIKWILQVAVTGLLLYFTLQKLEAGKLKEILSGISLWMILPVMVFLFFDMIINSYRILALYRFYGVKAKLLNICLVKFHGFFFSLFFPLLGDAYKIQAFKTKYGASYGKNSVVVLLDRLIYTFALTVILVPIWILNIIEINIVFKIVIVALFFLEISVLVLLNKPNIINKIILLPGRIHNKLSLSGYNFERKRKYSIEIAKNTLVAIIRHVFIALLYFLIAYTVMPEISFNVVLFILIVFSIMLSRVIPVSVGGIGLREYIAVIIFPQIGIAEEYAFTIAFIMSSIMIIQGILGGFSFLITRLIKPVKTI